ncbi:MAG: 3-phosphoshikimate 1-carboxyvinyltransferase [Oscillospiraceae bacterium]|nr:3-phosphoshikimate 1-carboxyvinyltransferase [Oscillospiraceae bacterium]
METVKQITRFPKGVVNIPPSKSVGHRALICAALAQEGGTVINPGTNDDITATLRCLKALGARYSCQDSTVRFYSAAAPLQEAPLLDCGESGSTLRFLIPVAASLGKCVRFTGHGRLMQRPQQPYIDCLKVNGVTLTQTDDILITEGTLQPGTFTLAGDVSSQFITGLLFALPLLSGQSKIVLSTPLQSRGYVDLTLAALADFGIVVHNENYACFTVPGDQAYKAPTAYTVEGDYSGAAFFLVAGALGADVTVAGLKENSAQGDAAILQILKRAGAQVTATPKGIKVTAKVLRPLTVDVSEIPDLVPPLAALMCFCLGESQIVNAARLRIKESDRLATVTSELNALGADITEHMDSLIIKGVDCLQGGKAHAHNDHRIAMMVATAAIRSKGLVTLTQPDCVKKSYADFWQHFQQIERDDIT